MHRLSVVARQTVESLELGVLADRVHRDRFVLSNHRILPSKGHLLSPLVQLLSWPAFQNFAAC